MANTLSPLAAAERTYAQALADQETARRAWWAIDWDNSAAEETTWTAWQTAQGATKAAYLDLLAATDAARESVQHSLIVAEIGPVATVCQEAR